MNEIYIVTFVKLVAALVTGTSDKILAFSSLPSIIHRVIGPIASA